jgi:hypothetical protein
VLVEVKNKDFGLVEAQDFKAIIDDFFEEDFLILFESDRTVFYTDGEMSLGEVFGVK